MNAPIESFETAMYDALSALRCGRWQDGLNDLERVEYLCRQYSFPEALPHVLANQVIALQHLGREQLVHQRWTELLTLLQSGVVEVESYRSLGPMLHYFAQHPSGGGYGRDWLKTQSLSADSTITPCVERTVGQGVTTTAMSQTHPAVVGAALSMQAAFSSEGQPLEKWSAVFLSQFGTDEQPDVYLDLIALLDATPPEIVRIYRCLCAILERPSEISPVVYFLAWLTAMRLETVGLPKKLAFSPNPPQELRLLYTLRLMNRLAETFDDVPGYEGVVHSIWYTVTNDVEHLDGLIQARRERGGKKSADIELFAEIACWRSMAAAYFGASERALEVLAPSAEIARKNALNARGTATKLLRLQAENYERLGRQREALLTYQRCVYLIFPKFDVDGHLHVFSEGLSRLDGDEEACLNVMLGLAGWIRNSQASIERLCDYADDLLSVLPESVSYAVRTEGGAHLYLALAYHGSLEAAKRSEVWAHAAGRCGLRAISLAYRVLLDESLLTSLSMEALQSELDMVEALPAGELRQSIQLLIAEAILGRRVRALRPTAETLIRRAGITLCTPRFKDEGDRYLLLLPCRWQNSLWTIIETASEFDLSTSLRPLLVSIAKHGVSGLSAEADAGLEKQLNDLADAAVDGFGQSGMIDSNIAEEIVSITGERMTSSTTRLPRLERPRGREVFLECYRVDGHWMFLVVAPSGGALLLPNKDLNAAGLSTWLGQSIGSHLKSGHRLYVVHDIPTAAVGFERHLGTEQSIDVVYGQRPSSEPLKWHDSLSMLMVGDRWTSTDLGSLRCAAREGISIEMCLDPEQYHEVTSAQWADVDVVLLGVAHTEERTLSLWDGGGPISVEDIAFGRGTSRNGLCVVVSPEQNAVHEQALQLAECFEAGVIVIGASEKSLEVIGTLISRSSLLLEPVDVITYLGKCVRDFGTEQIPFCTLYTGGDGRSEG